MAELNVTVIRADTNQAYDVDLPDDVPVAEVLAELVKGLGLPLTGPDGDLIAYEISNKRTGLDIKDGMLGTKGVKTGDMLLLTSSFVAGDPS